MWMCTMTDVKNESKIHFGQFDEKYEAFDWQRESSK